MTCARPAAVARRNAGGRRSAAAVARHRGDRVGGHRSLPRVRPKAAFVGLADHCKTDKRKQRALLNGRHAAPYRAPVKSALPAGNCRRPTGRSPLSLRDRIPALKPMRGARAICACY